VIHRKLQNVVYMKQNWCSKKKKKSQHLKKKKKGGQHRVLSTHTCDICYKNTFVVQKKISHVMFQQGIVSGLIGNLREGNKRRGRKSSIIHLPVTHPNQHHYIAIIPEGRRRKCVVCTDRNNTFRKSRISTWCSTCGVGDCFRKFHAGQEEWATCINGNV
jgi:hypothetical protein